MEYTKIRSPFQLDITNSPLDARIVVQTESDIMNISMPYVGMSVYCVDTGQRYTITELDSDIIIEGVFEVPDKKVKSYKLDTATINYRGEYTSSTPDNPADGDWFRNTTEGAAYIYQNNEWILMAKDGEMGKQGEPGVAGPSGQGIAVKGVLDSINDLPGVGDSKVGDAYVINGHLWVFGEDGTWYDAGPFQGDAGKSNFVDIRYSNDLVNKVFSTVGVYIGILVTEIKLQEPADFDLYTWSELAGTSSISVYKQVPSTQMPNKPNGDTLAAVVSDGWLRDPGVTLTGHYTWMSTAEFKNDVKLSSWTTPIRVTGKDGQPGIDGDGVQFAYHLSNSNTQWPDYNYVANDEDDYYMAEEGWTNNAKGVSKEFKYEWMSARYKTLVGGQKKWGAYQQPVVWASFGEDGMDGGCVEYIYYLTESVNPDLITYKPEEWLEQSDYNNYDWYPESDGWTDNPTGVDSHYTCEWVSTRKATPGDDGKLVWGKFEQPTLWAKYGKDGASPLTVALSNDNSFIICNTDGEEINADNRPTTEVSVFLGGTKITKDIDITATCNVEGITPYVDNMVVKFDITEGTILKDPFVITVNVSYENETDYSGVKYFVVNPINNPNYEYYELKLNTNVVRRDKDGNEYPQKIIAEVYKYNADGKSKVTVNSGATIYFDLDDKGSLLQYVNSVDCGSFQNIVTFYLKDSNGNQLDQQSVEVISDGVDGTSIEINDTVPTFQELQEIDYAAVGTVMYCEETGHLYMWDGKEWKDCGEIKGQPGEKAYIHIKYADERDPETGEYFFTGDNGEIPGRYMGTYGDNKYEDSDKWSDYKWYEIKGEPGVNGAKTVSIYTKSQTMPIAPTSTVIPEGLGTSDAWGTIMPELSEAEIKDMWAIYMCVGIATDGVNDDTVDGDGWQGPIRITGEKGEPGVDGTNIQYIYCLTDYRPGEDTPTLPTHTWDSEDYQDDNWVAGELAEGWTNNPQGIDYSNPTEWMSMRTKVNKVWGKLSNPIPWSVYGNTGQDGDGIEYIYLRTEVEEAPEVPQLTDEEEVPTGWSDNPIGVDADNPYEWVCTRRRKDGVWGDFTGSSSNPGYAALWASYGLKGESGDSVMYINTWRAEGVMPDQPQGGNIPSTGVPVPQSWSTSSEMPSVEFYQDLLDIDALDGEMRYVIENDSSYQYVASDDEWRIVTKYHVWVSHTIIVRSAGEYEWDVPFRITGDDGQPGTDGANTEFIYYSGSAKYDGTNAPTIVVPDDYRTNQFYQIDDYLPLVDEGLDARWSDQPQALDGENIKTVYFSYRKKPHVIEGTNQKVDAWGPFVAAKPWSVWGEKGQDGDGVNYVYLLSETLLNNTDLLIYHNALENWASDEIEEAKVNGDAISRAAQQLGFTDEPKNVSSKYVYQYVATRKQIKGEWSLEYSTPVVWAKYGKNGTDGADGTNGISAFYLDLDEQITSVPCSPDGALLVGNHVGALSTTQHHNPALDHDGTSYGHICIYHVSDTSMTNPLTYIDPLIKSYRIMMFVMDEGDMPLEEARETLPWFREYPVQEYDVNNDWVTTGIITFNSFPDNGWFELDVEVGLDNDNCTTHRISIPVGNIEDKSRFKTPLTIKGTPLLGNIQLTSDVTYLVSNNGLVTSNHTDSDGCENITVYGFTGQSVTTGKFTLTATYNGMRIHTNYTLAKAYTGVDGKDGSGAEFEIIQLKPQTSAIQVVTDAFGAVAESNYPESCWVYLNTITQDGTTTTSKVPSGYSVNVLVQYSGNAYNPSTQEYEMRNHQIGVTFNSGSDITIGDVSKYLQYTTDGVTWKQIPRYFEVALYRIGSDIAVDLEQIPFVASYKAPAADVPEWVTDWDGQTAKVDGNTMLTGKFYAGKSPTVGENWSGVLIGDDVTEIEGLPWREEKSPFTGILGLQGITINNDSTFDTPTYANATFALDSITGNSYFSGIAYDAKIDSCDITNCVVSSLRIVADLEYGSDATVFGNGTINIFTKSPVYNAEGEYLNRDQNVLTTLGYDPTDMTRIPSLRTSWYTPDNVDKYNPHFGSKYYAIDMGCEMNGALPYFEMFVRNDENGSGLDYTSTTFPSELISDTGKLTPLELSHITMNGFGQVFSQCGNTIYRSNDYRTIHEYNPYAINSNSWGVTWVNPTGVSVTRKVNYSEDDPNYGTSYLDSVIKIGQFSLHTDYGITNEFHGLFMDNFSGTDKTCAIVLPALSKDPIELDGWVFSCSLSDLVDSPRDDIQVLCIHRK